MDTGYSFDLLHCAIIYRRSQSLGEVAKSVDKLNDAGEQRIDPAANTSKGKNLSLLPLDLDSHPFDFGADEAKVHARAMSR
jgi:hypothetical protein